MADGGRTTDTQPTIGISGAIPGQEVDITVDGTEQAVTADGSGNARLTLPALSIGSHAVTADTVDANGDMSDLSSSFSFTVAPAAPSITTSGFLNNGSAFSVPLTDVDANATQLILYANGTQINSISTPATAISGQVTQPGTYALKVRQMVNGVLSDASAPVALTVDPTPTVNGITAGDVINYTVSSVSLQTGLPSGSVTVSADGGMSSLADVDSSGAATLSLALPLGDGQHTLTVISTDAAGTTGPAAKIMFTVQTGSPSISGPASPTSNQQPTFSLTGGIANSFDVIYLDGQSTGITVPTLASGNATWKPSGALADGAHTVATATVDSEGNIGTRSSGYSFTVDTTAPAKPLITSPADTADTNNAGLAVSVNGEPHTTVKLDLNGSAAGSATTDSSGNATITPTLAPLADGRYTATVTSTDVAGNMSTRSNAVHFTVDTTAPARPVIASPADGSYTNNPRTAFTVHAEPHATVRLSLNGAAAGSATADASGDATISPTSAPLADDSYTATVTATDAAQNTSHVSDPVQVTIDTHEPSQPVIISPVDGAYVDSSTPSFKVTAEPGATVQLSFNGHTDGSAAADSSGSATVIPPTALTDGTYTVTATATDQAGNTSVSSDQARISVDTAAPPPPTISSITAGATITDHHPRLVINGATGDTVTVTIDGRTLAPRTAGADGTATFAFSFPLADGAHTLSVTATDPAGNTSPTRTVHFTVITPPKPTPKPPVATPSPPTSPPKPPARAPKPPVTAPKPTPKPPAGAQPLQISKVKVSRPSVVWCEHCRYPTTQLRFTLNRAGSVRLALRVRRGKAWRQAAVSAIHGRKGVNRLRVAGRWHGQLVPARSVRILVQVRAGTGRRARWTTRKTAALTVRSPYTTKILRRPEKAMWARVGRLLGGR